VAGTPIREVTKPVLAVSASESIMRAMALMTERRVRHLPVFDNSELVGMVTLRDLIKFRLQEIEMEAMSSSDEPSLPSGHRDLPAAPTTLTF
jgi:signal-transduction protein with cAMP-binding, CBS, and nucleotidyltransferase domain